MGLFRRESDHDKIHRHIRKGERSLTRIRANIAYHREQIRALEADERFTQGMVDILCRVLVDAFIEEQETE